MVNLRIMIPTLLFLLYRKYLKQRIPHICRNLSIRIFSRNKVLIVIAMVGLLALTSAVDSEKQTLRYKVLRKGAEVGWIMLQKNTTGGLTRYELNSEISTRLLFRFTATAYEETEFKDGKMTYSYLYRKMNGNIKANKKTILKDSKYQVIRGRNQENLDVSNVTYNLHCLYFTEPTGIRQVYSDNFESFINIESKGNGIYKIKLPDGVINYFHYTNGKCSKVEIEHAFYSVQFILK